MRLNFVGISWILLLSSCSAQNVTGDFEQVQCSDNQEVFVAQTEFVLLGRNDFFDGMERNALQTVFLEIYNMFTRDSCDGYFRRLDEVTFVSMTNFLNETITSEDSELLSLLEEGPPAPVDGPPEDPSMLNTTDEEFPGAMTEDLPTPLPNELPQGVPQGTPPGNGFGRWRRHVEYSNLTMEESITTDEAGVSSVFNVTGTCRDCALSRSGSFTLFDDSFRLRIRFRVLLVEEKERALQGPPGGFPPANNLPMNGQPSEQPPVEEPPQEGILEDGPPVNPVGDADDCTCAPGLEPVSPQAPPVAELLNLLNQRLQQLQDEHGIFEDVAFADVMQLDDLDDLEEVPVIDMDEEALATSKTTKSSTASSQPKELSAQSTTSSSSTTSNTSRSSGTRRICDFLCVIGVVVAMLFL